MKNQEIESCTKRTSFEWNEAVKRKRGLKRKRQGDEKKKQKTKKGV